ncbi:hypothetical protein Tco_0492000 [Tanacetum coccineum]
MGQCNLRLKLPDVTSKEATLQVVFEVLILTLLQGIPSHADAPEDLYAEFLASAYIADVNVNKLHQPWRSFAAIINKCLSGKPSYDSLRLSQAQILWGVYNKKNIDYAYLLGRNSFSVENKKIREAEQLKLITKEASRKSQDSHASSSGADEGTGVTPGNDEQTQDDEDADKNDVNETTQNDEDDDDHDDDEKVQDDDDEEQTESEDDGDDFVHPKLTTHDDDIIHEEETDEDDSFDPTIHLHTLVQATQEIEDTHVTLTLVNPDGQQQSSYVSSGFVSNMLNPNQDTAIMEPSFTSQINRPPTPLKALENNFELRQTNQYAEALSSILGIFDQYLANKMQEAVDVAVQLNTGVQKEEGQKRTTASTSAPMKRQPRLQEKTTTTGVSKTHKQSASQSALVDEIMQTTDVFEAPAHQEFETGVHDEQAKEEVQHLPDWFQQPTRLPSPDHAWNKSVLFCRFNESVQHKPCAKQSGNKDKTLESPTFELMKGTCKSLTELEYFCEEVYKATTEKLDWINPEGRQYPHDLRQPLTPWESARDVYSKRLDYCCCHKGEIVEWQDYKHLDWITVQRDDDVLYKFKEGDFHRLRIQDIEDMLLLLVQGKVTNLNVEERIAFNVSLRMFTRSVDKKNTKGVWKIFNWELKAIKRNSTSQSLTHKKNRLMRIDELHKFSDGTLDDVRTALNDRLKGIRMEYLPQTFWSQRDKANARAMIQAIDKRLKTRRIMRSLERFVGGRPYGGDLRLLQRTI